MKKVFVGMSGGVDSSVTAALLKEQGYDVTGVFMKNWARDLPGFKCPWREDLADAKRVAVQLGIPFKIYDFQDQYKQKVVDYMIAEYEAGRTPNPDIMCNQEVKFKLFLETALEDGADLIATGHYARIFDSGNTKHQAPNNKQIRNSKDLNSKQDHLIRHSREDGDPVHNSERTVLSSLGEGESESASSNIKYQISNFQLLQSVDSNKDQTYFLYRVTEEALSKTLFPLGEMTKPEVRKKAAELGLVTATKKDSVGICFVGEIGIKDFLKNFVTTTPGDIVEKTSGKKVGTHEGALYYTIGQRHGLNVGGGMPYYVVGKDIAKNEVYVSTNLDDPDLWHKTIHITDTHWINDSRVRRQTSDIRVRTRHRGQLLSVESIEQTSEKDYTITLKDEVRALAPGQSAVIYQGVLCLGGGIIV